MGLTLFLPGERFKFIVTATPGVVANPAMKIGRGSGRLSKKLDGFPRFGVESSRISVGAKQRLQAVLACQVVIATVHRHFGETQ